MAGMSDKVAWLLGLEGISLLRAIAGDGFDRAFVGERLDEVERILAARRDPELADGPGGVPIGVRAGYDLWARTYDQPNPLIAVEQAVVWPWLERLPPAARSTPPARPGATPACSPAAATRCSG